MTLLRLCLRNLLYHWRGNLAVFLGVVVGCAVLTGALFVGDSLRGSLRERSLARALDVRAGDKIVLRLQRPSAIPRESALGQKKLEVEELESTVGRVLEGGELGNHFNLRAEVEAPRNAFVSLERLQKKLGQPG